MSDKEKPVGERRIIDFKIVQESINGTASLIALTNHGELYEFLVSHTEWHKLPPIPQD